MQLTSFTSQESTKKKIKSTTQHPLDSILLPLPCHVKNIVESVLITIFPSPAFLISLGAKKHTYNKDNTKAEQLKKDEGESERKTFEKIRRRQEFPFPRVV